MEWGNSDGTGGSIAVGLVLMLLVAPFLWFMGIGGLFVFGAAGLGLIGLAWVAGVAGFGLFVYGLVAKSDLEKAASSHEAPGSDWSIDTADLPVSACLPRWAHILFLLWNRQFNGDCLSCGRELPELPI